MNSTVTEFYFQRFGFCPRQIQVAPLSRLGLIVVIPCFNENTLVNSLEALWHCERPTCATEIIVVINSGQGASLEILQRNSQTLVEARSWIAEHPDSQFAFHLLDFADLPPKKAGVGLARKIGMDEALRRFDQVDCLDGVIVCFDADCTCDPNYLVEIERFFRDNPKSPGGSIYFEHPLEGPEQPEIYEAVTLYELHLRYYVEALRYAGFPHAFHTIGSSMAVRADVYGKQGGMNKRQAGEDFYFLHKIIPLGGFGEINTTRIIASPRPSDRVPFGTGRAVRAYLDTAQFESYPLQAFEDLRLLFAQVSSLYNSDEPIAALPKALQDFLATQDVTLHLNSIREHTSTPASFEKRFYRWFDGFLAMKYIHFARDTVYSSSVILEVSRDLYQRWSGQTVRTQTARDILIAFRSLQRFPKV